MEPYFAYELTAEPLAMFKDNSLRKGDKSVLARELRKKLSGARPTQIDPRLGMRYVLDGGWLLHKVKWQQGVTFLEILKQYLDYVQKHYGFHSIIVFDGYNNGPCTKDHEHERRSLNAAPDVVFDCKKPCTFNQSSFLANESNKKAFVNSLIETFQVAGNVVHQAHDDADTLIVARP